MFRAAILSLPLTGGLARARPDGLRGRSYSNPNTCACPDGPAPTDSSIGYLPVSTIRETVTECITVTESALTRTVYETVTPELGYGSDAVTETEGPEVVTITRTIIIDEAQTASDKERSTSSTRGGKTITVTYHDGVSSTRDSYETQPPSGYENDDYPNHENGETLKYEAPQASVTSGGQGYGSIRDYPGRDQGYDDAKEGGEGTPDYNVGDKTDGGDDYGKDDDQSNGNDDYDESTPGHHEGGDRYPENTSSGGSRGYPDSSNNGNNSNGNEYASQPYNCDDLSQPGRPCITTVIVGTLTRYQTVYPSLTSSAAASNATVCTLTTKLVTEYETILSTVKHTSSGSAADTYETPAGFYGTAASHTNQTRPGTYVTAAPSTYGTAVPDIYRPDDYESAATNSTTQTTTSTAISAYQTDAYLHYAKREHRGRLRNLAYQW